LGLGVLQGDEVGVEETSVTITPCIVVGTLFVQGEEIG
jgi:hypothetical protein